MTISMYGNLGRLEAQGLAFEEPLLSSPYANIHIAHNTFRGYDFVYPHCELFQRLCLLCPV